MNPPPVFLIGSERSGTTLLRLMLDHHPLISFQPEFEFAVEHMTDDGTWPTPAGLRDALATDRMFLASGLTFPADLSGPDGFRDCLEKRRRTAGKPLVGATVHRHFDRLLQIWPHARFIHMVRDGRDVAQSCIGMGWAGNVWVAADRWVVAERLWDALRSALPLDRWAEIRYEQLVSSPRDELERACRLFGVGFDPAMLEYPRDTTYSAPNPAQLSQWRRSLSNREIQLLESRIGDLLVARGYARSGLSPSAPTWLRRLALHAQDRWIRLRFRVGRYGFGLSLSATVARRARIQPWYRGLVLRMREIDARYLK